MPKTESNYEILTVRRAIFNGLVQVETINPLWEKLNGKGTEGSSMEMKIFSITRFKQHC